MVEQAAVNRKVEGSSPSLGAIFLEKPKRARTREGRNLRWRFLRGAVRKHERSGFSLRSKREPLPYSVCESMQIWDSACGASVSPSLGAIFLEKPKRAEILKLFAPEWRNWQTHRT